MNTPESPNGDTKMTEILRELRIIRYLLAIIATALLTLIFFPEFAERCAQFVRNNRESVTTILGILAVFLAAAFFVAKKSTPPPAPTHLHNELKPQ